MEKENELLKVASKFIKAEISPLLFKNYLRNNFGYNNVTLSTLIGWSVRELEEWSWNVSRLNFKTNNVNIENFIAKTLFILENIDINEVDDQLIKEILSQLKDLKA